jgi:hypothetical protein
MRKTGLQVRTFFLPGGMMDDSLLSSLFNFLDIAVLARFDDGSFRLDGTALASFLCLYAAASLEKAGFRPEDKFHG